MKNNSRKQARKKEAKETKRADQAKSKKTRRATSKKKTTSKMPASKTQAKTAQKKTQKPTTSEYIIVRTSSIHNKGVFAKKNIPKGAKILEYVGEKITKKESDNRYDASLAAHKSNQKNGAVYVFELNKRYDIDGNVSYNTAKYINHSCEPNCEVEIIGGHIWIMALKDIKKGEELAYNYGYNLDEWQEHPCRCGSKRCVGYIAEEELWPKLKRRIAAQKRKAKA